MNGTQVSLIAVNVTFCVLSILASSTRLHRTAVKTKTLQLHDVMLVLALFFGIAEAVLQCVLVKYELGTTEVIDPSKIDLDTLDTFYEVFITFFVCYFACNMFVKLSLLAFYRKLAPDNRYDWILWVMAFVAVGFGVGSIFSTVLACTPIWKLWRPSTPGTCINVVAFYYANSIFMIVNDTILYILPIFIVRRVQLSKAKAAAMNFLFALGFIVVAASIFRLLAIYNLFANPTQVLYYQAKLLIWCTVENHLALIIICLPACKAALVAFSPSLGSASSSLWSKIAGGRADQARAPRLPYASSDLSSSSHNSTKKSKPWFVDWTSSSSSSSGSRTNNDTQQHTSVSASRSLSSSSGSPRRPQRPDEIELRKDVYITVEEQCRASSEYGDSIISPTASTHKTPL